MAQTTIIADGSGDELPRAVMCRLARIDRWDLGDMSVPYWRCYAPIDPGGEIHWAGETQVLAPSTWLLIAPRTSCASRLLRPFRKAYNHFVWPVAGRRAVPGVYVGTIPPAQRRALRALAERPRDPVADRELALRLQAITAQALLALPAGASVEDPRYGPQVARAVALLRADPRRTPSNAELAVELDLHPGSLVRMFTREVGTSPQRYALTWRLEHAAALLSETDEGIEAIADRCGFGDRYHFSRAFARHWGRGPATYRRDLRG